MASGQVTCPHCGAESSANAVLCYNCNGDLRGPAKPVSASTVVAAGVGGLGIAYDAKIIEGYARKLYTQASVITVVYAGVGLVLGGAVLGSLGALAGSTEGGAIVGALLGGALGYFVGNMKASALRLEAQLALCQVAIERNTRSDSQGAALRSA